MPRSPQDWNRRRAGVLLHPTSLPGRHGIGDLGEPATRFLDFLQAAGARVWQILPLGPVGLADSPYAGLSTFAGNPLSISLDRMAEQGLLEPHELASLTVNERGPVDFPTVQDAKYRVLTQAAARFIERGRSGAFDAFTASTAAWLDDWALFAALRDETGRRAWTDWEPGLVRRDPDALAAARERLAGRIDAERFIQWVFFQQWAEVRRQASERGIHIIGDIPIFVAHDSADVWAHQDFLFLDGGGRPTVVAGVPPDYFSATGQRWGNPLYRWDVLAQSGYAWWVERLRAVLALVDEVRIDHFRGFAGYWEIPASEATAVKGRWLPGPGEPVFQAMMQALGTLPIIVEDLGLITPDVVALRDRLGYPGMKILQFAFDGGPDNPFLPYNIEANCVVYTGTHDNDTTVGWYHSQPEKTQSYARRYLGVDGKDIAWDLIRLALASVANDAIAPLQDLLALDTSARMNFPGTLENNWRWRVDPDGLRPEIAQRFADLVKVYGRTGA